MQTFKVDKNREVFINDTKIEGCQTYRIDYYETEDAICVTLEFEVDNIDIKTKDKPKANPVQNRAINDPQDPPPVYYPNSNWIQK